METIYPKIILSKKNANFIKNGPNNFSLFFSLQNNNIILPKIIDFDLIKTIYDLNTDIYEKVIMTKIDEKQVILNILFKPLFEDLGFPQIYSYINVEKTIIYHEESNKTYSEIIFHSSSITNEKPTNIPDDAKLFHLNDMIMNCKILDNHNLEFNCTLNINENVNIPKIGEKIIGNILYKILERFKLFIDKIS